jgi:DNA-binding transcriptional MerR regulator
MPSHSTYRIGELASQTGLTRDALRYYERLGLLPAPRRTSGGFRVYPPETIERVRFVKQAQLVGLTLQEIAALVRYQRQGGVKRCRQVRDLLRTKLTEVEAKLHEFEAFRTTLSTYLSQCDRTLQDASESHNADTPCPVIDTLEHGR